MRFSVFTLTKTLADTQPLKIHRALPEKDVALTFGSDCVDINTGKFLDSRQEVFGDQTKDVPIVVITILF
jgi:hypothetical protein